MLQITVCDNSWLIDYGNCRYVPTPEKQVTSGRTHVISRLFSGKEVARTGGPDFAKGVYAIKTFDPGSSSRLRYSQTNQILKVL